MKIGFLHPGNMGVSVAASAIASGHVAYWVSAGRGPATRARADEHGLQGLESVAQLAEICDVIFSICPPEAAEDVAGQVAQARFSGIYVDGNAVSPERMARVAAIASDGGADVVDGGIIGAAMIINLVVAALAGYSIPLILKQLRVDPALAGGVVLTTVTDVVGYMAFLGLGAIFLL